MQHAVVIGGSMAGLLGARVLSEYCERVTVVERDKLPDGAEQRRGVPQGRHTHGLLASGSDTLERYFPGLKIELVAGGAVPGDVLDNMRWFLEGGCHAQASSGLAGFMMTRPMLESRVRARVTSIPNVVLRENVSVDRLDFHAPSGRVIGVRAGSEAIPADLVVDATGRGSKMAEWLQEMDFDPPHEDRVEVRLAYTTRLFRRHPSDLDGYYGVVIGHTPEGKRGGVMLAQEGDRWTVTLITYFQPPAPEELDGFVEFARTLPAPYIYDTIRKAEALGEGFSSRFPASLRRRYERLTRFPEGLLAFGDAISSFNPIYGQGMSVACLQAVVLADVLRESGSCIARRFFTRAARVVDIPWSIAVGNDLRMPEVSGPRTRTGNFINWYMGKLHKAAHTDPVCAIAFHKVSNLLAPPSAVMHPRIAFRVAARSVMPSRTAEAAPKSSAAASS
jgi:2-polyprenyl-6-methoxyphenol hydroxylase-like FAD-dependent oxidoreductase